LKMKIPIECPEFTKYLLANIALTVLICASFLYFYDRFIDRQIKKVVTKPEAKNKITIKILAVGFSAAYCVMLFPMAKDTLDFQVYQTKIELYSITKALIFVAALTFGAISGGASLANIKGKQE
jgi:hypothetical protein